MLFLGSLRIPKGFVSIMASDNNDRSKELTTTEAAAYCDYSLGYFYARVSEIPHRKERKRNFFTIAALDEFKAAQSVEHIPEPAA